MKSLVLILIFNFFLLAVTSGFSYGASGNFHDTVVETKSNYLNGVIQMKTMSFIDKDGVTYKVVKEGYRKDGSKKYVCILDHGVTMLYNARYDKSGILISEKFYRYNFRNNLIQIEIKKDGVSKFKTFDTGIYGD